MEPCDWSPEAGHQLLGEVLDPEQVSPADLASGELDQGEVHHLPLLLCQVLSIDLDRDLSKKSQKRRDST